MFVIAIVTVIYLQDPVGYQDKFLNHYKMCRKRTSQSTRSPETPGGRNNVVWISTHVRPVDGNHKQEKSDVIVTYNLKMKEWFASNACGPVQHIDVTNMTHMLQLGPLRDNLKKKMTFDGMHFSRTLNVLKAHLILSSLV